jgi:methylphosphotriester-DNA--protein-cysteine methyltransferase
MIEHSAIADAQLLSLIRSKQITLAGNRSLKIYGLLQCSSGKRMKRENRIFFKSIAQAKSKGFRPCGHCLHKEYLQWKKRAVT